LPKIISGVQVDEDMIVRVTIIKYSNHDVVDVTKFPDLNPRTIWKAREKVHQACQCSR
jgi:hypothetical protein